MLTPAGVFVLVPGLDIPRSSGEFGREGGDFESRPLKMVFKSPGVAERDLWGEVEILFDLMAERCLERLEKADMGHKI